MNIPRRLLAKSTTTPDSPANYESYSGHILEATNVAHHLVTTRGRYFLGSMGLDVTFWLNKLESATSRGAFIHDIGKANHQFQRMLRGESAHTVQAFRHEIISLKLALTWQPVSEWLFEGCSDDTRYAILFSAVGHHLKFENFGLHARDGSGDDKILIYTGHEDVKDLLRLGKSFFRNSKEIATSANIELDLLEDPMNDVRRWLQRDANAWWENCDTDTKKFVSLVKSLVIDSDIIASAVTRYENVKDWIDKTLGRVCSESEVCQIVTTNLEGKPPRPFQRDVEAASSRVVFVSAGCGAGKTVGAYLWAAKKAANKKLFVCYPTTGTATEGYKDYELAAKIDSRLLHSRSEVDIERLLEGSEDKDALEYSIKYDSLQAYDVPIVVATADTVLGLIQNNRTGQFSFPSIGEAVFIFDEIHSYDGLLFGALLRFIDTFRGVPILLLTASLQSRRIMMLEEVLRKNGENLQIVKGPKELEDIKRYIIHWCDRSYPWDEVRRCLTKGEKVLWVVNTVDRARQLADEANNRLAGIKIELYHSRYRYFDRVKRHAAVMDGFDIKKEGPILAITTQVCEVSLDISADLLVTDNAPIPALIQRMGRVNRFLEYDNGDPKHVYVVEPREDSPYERNDLILAKKWISTLQKRDAISQSVLDSTFRKLEQDESNISMDSSWLDGGPLSRVTPLRESGYTISVIRGEDVPAVKRNDKVINSELAKFTIPMLYHPVAKEIKMWQRLNGVFVAPAKKIEYSDFRGGNWRISN